MTLRVLSVNSTDQATNKLWVWPPVCFCLLSLPFAILSSPKVAYSTFRSSRDRITLKYCWCPAARDAGHQVVVYSEDVCVWACVHMCNSCNEEQQDRWHQLLCSALFSCSLTSVFWVPFLFLFCLWVQNEVFVPVIHGNWVVYSFWSIWMNDIIVDVIYSNRIFVSHPEFVVLLFLPEPPFLLICF